MDLVEHLWPRLGQVWAEEAQRLRNRLGACQDLAVLAATTAPHQPLAPWRSRLMPLIDERRGAHNGDGGSYGDDVLAMLLEARHEDGSPMSPVELRDELMTLLVAGHETTTNLIGNGTLALLRHPDELERLRAEPALLENAVEELLRYDSPVQATVRVTLEDLELGEQKIAANALVICGIGAVSNVGVATFIYAHDNKWWIAGLGGAVMGAVWNYAVSSVFVWRGR